MRVSDEGRRGGWVREERGKDVIKKSNEEVREIKFREEREYNKKMIKILQFMNSTVSKLRQCYSPMPKILEFKISVGRAYLVFGMPNAKYLIFGTPDRNALKKLLQHFYFYIFDLLE